jgi:hypothetical protein
MNSSLLRTLYGVTDSNIYTNPSHPFILSLLRHPREIRHLWSSGPLILHLTGDGQFLDLYDLCPDARPLQFKSTSQNNEVAQKIVIHEPRDATATPYNAMDWQLPVESR